jgi:uncharacterized protein YkwD
MTDNDRPTTRLDPPTRIKSDDLPDWVNWTDESQTATEQAADSSEDWLDDALTDDSRRESTDSEDTSDTELRLTVCRLTCRQCETGTVRRQHAGCTAPIIRVGDRWRCADCGTSMSPPFRCQDCGDDLERRGVVVPVDLRPQADTDRIERVIHSETNDRRAAHSLVSLSYSDHLSAIALQHSRDMAVRDFFDHTCPDDMEPVDRYRKFGHSVRNYGENIAKIYPGPTTSAEDAASEVVDEWMESPGHRENILQDQFKREGIGVYFGRDGAMYATQNFY